MSSTLSFLGKAVMFSLLISLLLAPGFVGASHGHLIVAGGGPLPPEITEKALALSGGKKAHVLIIPQASGRTDAGRARRASGRMRVPST